MLFPGEEADWYIAAFQMPIEECRKRHVVFIAGKVIVDFKKNIHTAVWFVQLCHLFHITSNAGRESDPGMNLGRESGGHGSERSCRCLSKN